MEAYKVSECSKEAIEQSANYINDVFRKRLKEDKIVYLKDIDDVFKKELLGENDQEWVYEEAQNEL